ncbi:hypothetical protein FNO01nite_08520 [Flavobacterium noncentrifugens]|uniref:Uncharacterized protein n=1 Tax=Flavobacterium noncentrifugens TaxID=1128970 RepID=A0A1G8TCY6_9FLAO|nr:hypothetical protein [Flavobacterium noncentrifugens]GEP50180.1 hypothetical protein FNO01nite_08520 [Flavobacterium noncentrifugens]SDJ39436.1 hypothetical protein SAMN04487935_0928 [Flavobacterium noncentrifugens]
MKIIKHIYILVFALITTIVNAQLNSDDLLRGDSFDINLHLPLQFPSTANEEIVGSQKRIEDINFYKDLRLKGRVKSFKQVGHNIVNGTEAENFPIEILEDGRHVKLLERHNIEAMFNENQKLLSIKLYTPLGKLNCSITNQYSNNLLTQSVINVINEFKDYPSETAITYTYEAKVLKSKIAKSERFTVSTSPTKSGYSVNTTNYKYGTGGFLSKEIESVIWENNSGTLTNQEKDKISAQYVYDPNSNLKTYSGKNAKSNFIYKTNKLVKINDYYFITYNQNGQVAKKTYKSPSESSYQELKYYYTPSKSIDKIVYKSFMSDENYYLTTYKYNENQDVVTEERLSFSDLDLFRSYRIDFEYEYDDSGNWIKRSDFMSGERKRIINREIHYY